MVLQVDRSEGDHDPSRPNGNTSGRALLMLLAAIAAVVLLGGLALVLGLLTVRSSESISPAANAPATSSVAPAANATTTPAGLPVKHAIWPDPFLDARYRTAEDAVRSFAVELAGYAEPIVGPFTDELDGAVELRPNVDGPLTMVQVRQDPTDGAWFVVGAGSRTIRLDRPGHGEAIDGTMTLAGRNTGGGPVLAAVHLLGTSDPVVTVTMDGSADGGVGAFDDAFAIPGVGNGPGFLIVTVPGGPNGSTIAVAAVPLTIG